MPQRKYVDNVFSGNTALYGSKGGNDWKGTVWRSLHEMNDIEGKPVRDRIVLEKGFEAEDIS